MLSKATIGVTDPYIPIVAYTEEQTAELCYGTLRVILEEGPLASSFDIDIVNSHPTMLYNYCLDHSVPAVKLHYYLTRRKKILAFVMRKFGVSRREAKDGFLAAINNGVRNIPTRKDFFFTTCAYSRLNMTKNLDIARLPRIAGISRFAAGHVDEDAVQ